MALSAVNFMCELDEHEPLTRVVRRRFRCFEDAAVIAYGRAFTGASGLPALSFKQLELEATDQERSLHDELMERRHKVIAHSDADRQRILFATEPFVKDGMTVMLPRMDFDDALAFFSERLRLIAWLRRLIDAASKVLFDQMQHMPEVRFVRDHTLTAEPGRESA